MQKHESTANEAGRVLPRIRPVKRFGRLMWECAVIHGADSLANVVRLDAARAWSDAMMQALNLLANSDIQAQELVDLKALLARDASIIQEFRQQMHAMTSRISDLSRQLAVAKNARTTAEALQAIAERKLGVALDMTEQRRQEILRQDAYITRLEDAIKAAGVSFRFERANDCA